MKNVTVTLPEPVLDRLRVMAAKKSTSLNRLVRDVLTDVAESDQVSWKHLFEAVLQEVPARAGTGTFDRAEIYEERFGRLPHTHHSKNECRIGRAGLTGREFHAEMV